MRTENERISTLEANAAGLERAIGKLDVKLDKVLLAISRVEVLETKHNNSDQALARAFHRIERAENELHRVDRELQENINKLRGMRSLTAILWTVLVVAVTAAYQLIFGAAS